jgi:toxin ParE1/3/4
MEYEIVWTEPAGLQLEEICDYISVVTPSPARKVVQKIIARVERLRSTPRLGTIYRAGGKRPIRKIVSGKYRIFYRILEIEKRVEVLVVWHGARRDPELPENS